MAAADPERAALVYLGLGWSVIPMRPRGKRPAIRWQAFQRERAGEDQVRGWFARWPDANVGVVTGSVSGLVVLDVDPRHGGDVSLAGLEREHGALPRTVEAVTGGGGRHLYFAHPGPPVRNRVGLAPGIDLRGDGGCVVAPPSLHPSGERYRWVRGRAPGHAGLAPLPDWLGAPAHAHGAGSGHSPRHWRELLRRGVDEGERNDAVASVTGHLLWHGVDAGVALELVRCWNRARCRPPLADAEVADVVRSIARVHERRSDGA